MPIKTFATVLGLVVLVGFWCDNYTRAVSRVTGGRAVETRDVVTMRKMRFRVVTTGTAASTAPPSSFKSKDVFRFAIKGVQIQDQDKIAFTIEGPDGRVDLGSSAFDNGNFLTLRRRRATAVLNFPPYQFPKTRLRFNPNHARINFFSGKGLAQATPVLSALGLTTGNPITVTMHVRRPGDGDFDFVFTGQFRIRHTLRRRSQLHVYRANGQ